MAFPPPDDPHHVRATARRSRSRRRRSSRTSTVTPETRVPAEHPLRQVRHLVCDVLKGLSQSLGRLYASEGRPSVPPEQLLSALLLQVFYSHPLRAAIGRAAELQLAVPLVRWAVVR